jgi:hypothetical protein
MPADAVAPDAAPMPLALLLPAPDAVAEPVDEPLAIVTAWGRRASVAAVHEPVFVVV